jgi:hypothetical protein
MTKTKQHLERIKAHLLHKHPELAHAATVPLNAAFDSWAGVSAFIEACWASEYRDEARIIFLPEYLAFAFGPWGNQPTSVAVVADGQPVSILLGADIAFESTDGCRRLKAMIVTGLSTKPECRGRGYGQWNYVAQSFVALEEGHDFAVAWLDSGHNRPGSSHATYGRKDTRTEFTHECRIMAKALDVGTLWGLGLLRRRERWAALGIARCFPPEERLPSGVTMRPLEPADAPECIRFMRDVQSGPWRRVFTPEEFSRRYLFEEGAITARAWLLLQRGKLLGFAYGYTNPIRDEARYFALDGLLHAPGQGYRLRRRFLAAVETRCLRELGCSAVVAAPTACDVALLPMGYAPLAKHILGAQTFHEDTGLNDKTLGQLLLEIR